jgi:hypothetical protein
MQGCVWSSLLINSVVGSKSLFFGTGMFDVASEVQFPSFNNNNNNKNKITMIKKYNKNKDFYFFPLMSAGVSATAIALGLSHTCATRIEEGDWVKCCRSNEYGPGK